MHLSSKNELIAYCHYKEKIQHFIWIHFSARMINTEARMWVVLGTAVGVAYSLSQHNSINILMKEPAGHHIAGFGTHSLLFLVQNCITECNQSTTAPLGTSE